MTLEALRTKVIEGVPGGLEDDPDCLGELEHTYSVFRFRFAWGTLYEVTFTNHADAEDRSACWGLIPAGHLIIDTIETDTMGVGSNGVTMEMTHRLVAGQ